MSKTINIVNDLLSHGGILIGSRALGVEHTDSDYDIAILETNLPEYFRRTIYSSVNDGFNIRNYFHKLPPLGNSWIIRKYQHLEEQKELDIIIFESRTSLETMQKVIQDMKKINKKYLEDKFFRVMMFERGLSVYGWKDLD